MIKPKIAIVANINRSFPDTNTTLEDVAEEMKKLVETVPSDGKVILNGNDKRVKRLAEYAKAPVVKYGRNQDCEVRIKEVNELEGGQEFTLDYKGNRKVLRIERFGEHNINALVIAKIVAEEIEALKVKKINK
jgi:UDP-N-acetylmuramoyl-tripeptide--D-alanyl-D-alanine ligase